MTPIFIKRPLAVGKWVTLENRIRMLLQEEFQILKLPIAKCQLVKPTSLPAMLINGSVYLTTFPQTYSYAAIIEE